MFNYKTCDVDLSFYITKPVMSSTWLLIDNYKFSRKQMLRQLPTKDTHAAAAATASRDNLVILPATQWWP